MEELDRDRVRKKHEKDRIWKSEEKEQKEEKVEQGSWERSENREEAEGQHTEFLCVP